jgi:hypothetical protein
MTSKAMSLRRPKPTKGATVQHDLKPSDGGMSEQEFETVKKLIEDDNFSIGIGL